MERAEAQLVRSQGMKEPPGQGEPFEGGSAPRLNLSRSADTLQA